MNDIITDPICCDTCKGEIPNTTECINYGRIPNPSKYYCSCYVNIHSNKVFTPIKSSVDIMTKGKK